MIVFVINPGYSLKNAVELWNNKNFPGQVLYGVQYFRENGIEPLFQQKAVQVLESSKGAGKKEILKSRLRYEINVIKEYKKNKKDIDAVYVPVMGFGTLFLLLKKLGFIRKPVIGVAHSMNFEGKMHIFKNNFSFGACSRVVFLSEKVMKKASELFPKYSSRFFSLPLMPDPINEKKEAIDKKYAFAMIGKTNRDYNTISEAALIAKLPGIIVGGWTLKGIKTSLLQ